MSILKCVGLDLFRISSAREGVPLSGHKITDIVGLLTDEERVAVQRQSKVFRARHAGFASCLGSLAAELVLADEELDRNRLGIVVAGGAGHICPSLEFTERAIRAGVGLVNPAQFPHLLPSAVAVTIAATIASHGPALAIGHERGAFSTALRIAELLISGGVITHCLVISVCESDWPCLPSGLGSARVQTYPDGVIAVLVGEGDDGVIASTAISETRHAISDFVIPPVFGEAIDFWLRVNSVTPSG